jgi:ubiquinol-cytochrome c reductase cytochrome b subunit
MLLPIIIIKLIALHFYSLRTPHVNNQDGEDIDFDTEAEKYQNGNPVGSKVIPFWPVFLSKDTVVIGVFMIFFAYLAFYQYGFALDPINFVPADPLKTPAHIYPEWYFLWSYEVLRGFFFSSDMGLVAFAIANGIFFLMPFLDRNDKVVPTHQRPYFKYWFWILIVDLIVLTIYGKLPPTGINAWVGFVASVTFLVLFAILPVITKKEANKMGGKA